MKQKTACFEELVSLFEVVRENGRILLANPFSAV